MEYKTKTAHEIEIIFDILYKGNVKLKFEFHFHYLPLILVLDVEILELYGKMGLLF